MLIELFCPSVAMILITNFSTTWSKPMFSLNPMEKVIKEDQMIPIEKDFLINFLPGRVDSHGSKDPGPPQDARQQSGNFIELLQSAPTQLASKPQDSDGSHKTTENYLDIMFTEREAPNPQIVPTSELRLDSSLIPREPATAFKLSRTDLGPSLGQLPVKKNKGNHYPSYEIKQVHNLDALQTESFPSFHSAGPSRDDLKLIQILKDWGNTAITSDYQVEEGLPTRLMLHSKHGNLRSDAVNTNSHLTPAFGDHNSVLPKKYFTVYDTAFFSRVRHRFQGRKFLDDPEGHRALLRFLQVIQARILSNRSAPLKFKANELKIFLDHFDVRQDLEEMSPTKNPNRVMRVAMYENDFKEITRDEEYLKTLFTERMIEEADSFLYGLAVHLEEPKNTQIKGVSNYTIIRRMATLMLASLDYAKIINTVVEDPETVLVRTQLENKQEQAFDFLLRLLKKLVAFEQPQEILNENPNLMIPLTAQEIKSSVKTGELRELKGRIFSSSHERRITPVWKTVALYLEECRPLVFKELRYSRNLRPMFKTFLTHMGGLTYRDFLDRQFRIKQMKVQKKPFEMGNVEVQSS